MRKSLSLDEREDRSIIWLAFHNNFPKYSRYIKKTKLYDDEGNF